MGNPSPLRYACAVAAIAGLTACNPPARQSDVDAVRAEAATLAVRVSDLEAQVSDLTAQLDTVRTVTLSTADAADGLRDTVNNNVKVANANALREMTARGDCGTRLVPIYSRDDPTKQVGIQNQVIPCTMADLAP